MLSLQVLLGLQQAIANSLPQKIGRAIAVGRAQLLVSVGRCKGKAIEGNGHERFAAFLDGNGLVRFHRRFPRRSFSVRSKLRSRAREKLN